nr:microcephalin-like [Procambarus clarkii]
MKKRGRGRQKTPLGSKKTSPDLQDVLFNPQMRNSTGATSLVVPETPTNSSTSVVTGSTFTSVMETPDDELLNIVNNCVTNADNKNHEHNEAVVQNSDQINETNDDSLTFAITPDLNLGRTKKLLSILESEHSFAKSLQSQQMKNSSMLFGQNNNNERRRTRVTERVGMLSPVKGKKRLSLADIILPFDLNNSTNGSHKVRSIIEKEHKPRRSMNTPTKPLPTNSRKMLRSQLPNKGDSKVEGDNLEVGKGENVTLHFNSEDLQLTPVVSSSQQALENTIHGIIEGLESQNLDETDPVEGQPPCLLNGETQKQLLLSLKKMKGRRWSVCGKVACEALPGAQALARNLNVNLGGSNKALSSDMSLPDNNPERLKKDNCDAISREPAKPQPELKSILSGVVAYVEVRMECDNRSAVIKEHVRALGAEVQERLNASVTHVIFRDGSKTVFNRAMKRGLHLVSSLWVEACREQQQRVPEALYPSCSIETYSKPLLSAKLRRLRSMQPKELSEEEKLATARARRRLKAVSSPSDSSASSNKQFAFPSYNSEKEAVNSPLFGISHLLTPRQRQSVSSASSEDDENNSEFLSQGINTPLVKRLYDRFFSPKSDGSNTGRIRSKVGLSFDSSSEDVFCGSDEERSARGRVESSILENEESRLTIGSKTQSDESVNLKLRLSNSNNNVEAEEMPVRLTGKPSKSETNFVNPLQDEKGNIQESVYSSSSEFEDSELVKSSSLVADASRGQCEGESMPARCDSGDTPPSRPDNCYFNHNDTNIENKSPVKRKSVTSQENAVSEVNELITKCLIGPKEKKSRINAEETQMNVRITRSKTKSCSNNNKKIVKKKTSVLEVETQTSRSSKKKKTDVNVTSEKESFSFDFSQKTSECNNFSNKDLNSDKSNSIGTRTNSVDRTSITNSIDDQHSFIPDSQNTFFSSSQARRRKLLSVDVLMPSQELIIPVTPDGRDKIIRGPYAGLQIKGARTQRAALRDQKDRNSSMPLPRNHKNSFRNRKKSVEFTSLIKGPKYEPTSEEREFVYVQSNSSSQHSLCKEARSDEDELFSSSGDESIFLESKIRPLPQPRKSIEEFQLKNGLKRREKKGKSKSGKNPSICFTSVHSKEMGSLISIIKKLRGYRITEHVNTSTTHVVCGASRRTMNLLFGIALGCWVVDVSWLYQSLEMETWAPEEPFEIFTFSPGAKICREQKQRQGTSYKQTLFSGVGNIFVQEGCVPPSSQLRDLLQLCGAVVVSNVRSANLVIGKPTAATETRGNFAKITHVSEKWVLDSIQYHKLQPFHLSPSQTT